MKLKSALSGLALLAGISGPAFAAATPEEAQRLTDVFQTYLGKEPGVVTVTPEGDSYRARFDAAPLFAKIREPNVTLSLTPIEWLITPQGGGKWQVDQDQPLAFQMKAGDAAQGAEGAIEFRIQLGSYKGTGVFDEALSSFASTSSELKQIAMDQQMSARGQESRTISTADSISVTWALTGSADDAESTMNIGYQGLRQTFSGSDASGAPVPAMAFSQSSSDGKQTITSKGLKPKAIADLIAWFVQRPSGEAIAADQAELKGKLKAAMPLVRSMSSTQTMNALAVNTVAGSFGLQQLGLDMEVTGFVSDGYFRQRFSFTGISAPQELVQPWVADIIPQDFVLDFNVSKYDLAAAAALFIDKMDLAKDPPVSEAVESELIMALLPGGVVQIGLGPSEILAKAFNLKAEGGMTAGPAVMPAGKALLKLTGMDQLMAALQAAPPEMEMQNLAPMLLLVRGLARQEADGSLSWAIESTPTGGVTVNGTDLTKMIGGQ
ncbi:MAG: hypothetical protein ACKOED_17575 [Aestuariivirga sp.]|uniref:hypothetical protein n=1 Tax=Aestuariivirga sp. TaxID=2650926 RepID=UPI0038D13942